MAESEYDLASSIGSVATLTPPSPPAQRVLLVALEAMLAERTRRQLEREGYSVRLALNEVDAIHLTRSSWPHLIVLDVSSSGTNDLGTFERLRFQSDVLIVMLSPLADEEDRVNGLNRGADDFLPRPASPRELAARVTSVLRRSRRPAGDDDQGCVVAGAVTVNQRTHEVTVGGRPIALTGMEFKLLRYFVGRPYHALDRSTLLEHVWGYTIGDGSTVTVHVRRLREKIKTDPAAPSLIRTVWGLGYAFHPYPTATPASTGTLEEQR